MFGKLWLHGKNEDKDTQDDSIFPKSAWQIEVYATFTQIYQKSSKDKQNLQSLLADRLSVMTFE